ncbi:hypothetical protein LUZ60_015820 [Juncus effusus]|nr:hypothetical protein LUZ60_015820 [Juncus effusus]
MEETRKEQTTDGVLLYYKYVKIPDLQSVLDFYDSGCRSLRLVGRVRIAPDGVNVTVGGKMESLEKHIEEMKLNPLFDGTDFKLASCESPTNERISRECGFDSLSIRVVKELVTFRSNPVAESPEISNAGQHLSALEFHELLHNAGVEGDKEVVVLDARNVYETRIGKFEIPNLETLDPEIRQYSDLPSWIDQNSDKLKDKSILMYCTGGIRCEMASAYIRTKGSGFENVFQLYGGIQRYLEQFPDGGYFKGKNFVFDHRISVGSSDSKVVGTCLKCKSSFDDYSSRKRCCQCRMLVLICHNCQVKSDEEICELCRKNEKDASEVGQSKTENEAELISDQSEAFSTNQIVPNDINQHRKLRILCLHGFRQNASSFKGRTFSLAKKLKNLAELFFIDAPHELPFIHVPNSNSISPPNQFSINKFAWLVSPHYNSSNNITKDWVVSNVPFDPLQFMDQTEGFEKSCEHLDEIILQKGPFDGILGFSQGAAMAALYLNNKQIFNKDILGFKFGIFCSGYRAPLLGLDSDPIRLPSLHCFGNGEGEKDRQIDRSNSVGLCEMFDESLRVLIEHDLGHIIPTRSPYIDGIKDFLARFT